MQSRQSPRTARERVEEYEATRITRRFFLKAATIAGGLALGGVATPQALLAGKLPPEPGGASLENNKAGSVFDQAERETLRYLDQIEQDLRIRLENEDEPFSEEVRMWFIRLSMLPVVSDWVSEFLEFLGGSATARERLSFLMPIVRWMSEPFLFPVETQGTQEERQREIERIFVLMGEMKKQGFTTTLDNVGDASLSPEDAEAYRKYYSSLIRAFIASESTEELYMSLKLSALVHDLDAALGNGASAEAKRRELSESIVQPLKIAAEAPERSIFLRMDMEEYAYKDLTLRLFREAIEKNLPIATDASGKLRLGVVIQAYLRDSARDVRELVEWGRARNIRVPIRLVKGAYLDFERELAAQQGYASPVWDHKPSTDANYEALSAYMLLNLDAVDPAFATHNIRTQAHAMALAETYGLPPDTAPIQMLYGMGDPIKHVVASMHRPLREYIPAGSLARGLKYAGRRFAELAGGDNALAKTMRGDFSDVNKAAPVFMGQRDKEDAEIVRAILEQALAQAPFKPRP